MSQYRLTEEIVARSVADTWDVAKLEWKLHGIYFADESQTCLCGHYPIIEICTILNQHNDQFAEVGNCCVKKFLGLPSDKIFQAIKRIQQDATKSLNAEAILHARERGWINDWERDFYLDIVRRRGNRLTIKQATKRLQINQLVLNRMSDARKPD